MLFVGNIHCMDWLMFLFPHNTNFLKGYVYLQAWKEDNDSKDVFTILSNTLQYFLFNISEIDIDTQKLLFEDVRVKDRPKQIEFMVIPFITMGKKKFDCIHGVDRNRSLKKKKIRWKSWKSIYIWNDLNIYIFNLNIYIYVKRFMYIYHIYHDFKNTFIY